jgi:predicted nucleotide-binding protein (sugar kinase/HSP70/actin superfamily)
MGDPNAFKMETFFKEKPSAEETTKYEEKLSQLLQYIKAKVKIKLLDHPYRIESYINNVHTDATYFWIDVVEVTTPEITCEVNLFSQNLGHENPVFDQKYAWTDAFEIQEQIYRNLGKNPGTPPNADPYWKLWDLR